MIRNLTLILNLNPTQTISLLCANDKSLRFTASFIPEQTPERTHNIDKNCDDSNYNYTL